MNKHTPAPWKVKGTAPSLKVTANEFTVATIIATSKADAETKEANARLIAAAPELLEVCETVLSALNSHQAYHKDMRPELRAVIAKAKGA